MTSKLILLLTLFGAGFGSENNNLFTILDSESTDGIVDCNNDDALGCQKIEVCLQKRLSFLTCITKSNVYLRLTSWLSLVQTFTSMLSMSPLGIGDKLMRRMNQSLTFMKMMR